MTKVPFLWLFRFPGTLAKAGFPDLWEASVWKINIFIAFHSLYKVLRRRTGMALKYGQVVLYKAPRHNPVMPEGGKRP